MEVMENMINEEMVEMVQEAANTVVETQATNGGKAIIEQGLWAAGVVIVWELGKFAVKKGMNYLEAKKAAKAEAEEEARDFADQDDDIVDIQ